MSHPLARMASRERMTTSQTGRSAEKANLDMNCVQRHGNTIGLGAACSRASFASRPRAARFPFAAGFTLIELILILALLAIVTSMAAPSLSRFFRGRALGSEARQLLSLTHAGQSRAISEGFPVLLWIDPQHGEYGLQLEATSQTQGSTEMDSKAENFTPDANVRLEALDGSLVTLNGRSVNAIRFLPDGTADESSPSRLRLSSESGDVLWLIQNTNRLGYAIFTSDR
jgi:type II secretion system protein H